MSSMDNADLAIEYNSMTAKARHPEFSAFSLFDEERYRFLENEMIKRGL